MHSSLNKRNYEPRKLLLEMGIQQDFGIVEALKRIGVSSHNAGTSTGKENFDSNEKIESYSPVDDEYIGSVSVTTAEQYESTIDTAHKAFLEWRDMPAPKRGEMVRQFGNKLREYKEDLGKLVSYEMGKSYQEGLGEVQEMIDICDFAVGLSRQLHGLTIKSERSGHHMQEQWHPMGIVGIISAFNFPVAVWSWNTALVPRFAVMYVFGSLLRRRPYVELLVNILSMKCYKRIIFPKEFLA